MACPGLDLTKSVDIWWASLDDLTDGERSGCIALLGPSEIERYQAFKVESPRTQFLAARGLLRTTLSRYRDVAPEHWVFSTNRYGRPFIVEKEGDVTGPFFSVSHTDGLVVCAIAAFPDIGVDVERRHREIDIAEVASSVLSDNERAWLDIFAQRGRSQAFFTLWTLKEAYAKARGMGLSLALSSIAFGDIGTSPRVSFGPEIADDPTRWTFQTIPDAPDHIISLAISSGGAGMPLTTRRARVMNTAA